MGSQPEVSTHITPASLVNQDVVAPRTLSYSPRFSQRIAWFFVVGVMVLVAGCAGWKWWSTNRLLDQIEAAISAKDTTTAKHLLDQRPDLVNTKKRPGDNDFLTEAVYKGDVDMVRLLIDKGANLNPLHNNPLSTAAEYGDTAIITLLLDRGARINRDDGGTPLQCATHAINLQSSVVKLLIDRGADVNYGVGLSKPLASIEQQDTPGLFTEQQAQSRAQQRREITRLLIAAGAKK